mmetsp:Transcript_2991/g.8163  ORF Transcript_2991/g.8163 Transcript_2991/m.8163 type:complete len:83 (-) Transcript_2991:293-541(-)
MFQVRLLVFFITLACAQAKTQFIRGELINPASRNVVNRDNDRAARKEQSAFSSSSGMNNPQNFLEFQAVKKVSGSQPSRKSP